MATMQVDIVSAERQLFSGQANEVFARSVDGEIGILPGHQPALLALGEAPVRVRTTEGEEVAFAIHNGFLEFADDQLTVLADVAELVGEIDVPRAEAARQRAQDRLANDPDDAIAKADLARAQLRLRLAGSDTLGAH